MISASLYDDLRVGVAGGEGVHPGEAELAGAVGAMRGWFSGILFRLNILFI